MNKKAAMLLEHNDKKTNEKNRTHFPCLANLDTF